MKKKEIIQLIIGWGMKNTFFFTEIKTPCQCIWSVRTAFVLTDSWEARQQIIGEINKMSDLQYWTRWYVKINLIDN